MNRIDSIDQSFLDRLYKTIEDNLANEHFGVVELTQEVGVSRSQLHRKLHVLTGQTASQVIREYRLKKAKEMLENEVATVAEISYRVGFGSPSYFNTCFHDYIGYPPGEAKFRKSIEEKRNPIFSKKAILISLSVMIVFALIYYSLSLTEISVHKTSKPMSIAVKPFDNASLDSSNIHFVNGMMDEIRNNLSKISELRVIPKSTTEKYRNTIMSASEIGKELGVSYLVEGTVQKLSDQVRIHAQLISVANDDIIWEDTYDRNISDLTPVLIIQSDIAKQIAKELNVVITPEEEKNIETIPTSDFTAYHYYLRGKEYQNLGDYQNLDTIAKDLRIAIQMYKEAVKIDSTYFLAWVGLAASSRELYWRKDDRSKEHFLRIKDYLEKAISLSPNQKEVLIEEGSYYFQCKLDYSKALQILEPLKSKYPNDGALIFQLGAVSRGMGEFKKSLEYFDLAISLNPSDSRSWEHAALCLWILRKYSDAEKYLKTAIDINPTNIAHYWWLVAFYESTGQLNKARNFLQINQPILGLPSVSIEILERNYVKAIQITDSLPEDFTISWYSHSKHLLLARIYRLMGDKEMAAKHFKLEIDYLLDQIDKSEFDGELYGALGIAYAGLGMKKEAIKAGEKEFDFTSFANDASGGINPEMNMISILVMIGEYDEAVTRLANIISHSGFITADILKLHPLWDPVREMDEFKAIINNPEYQVNLSEN